MLTSYHTYEVWLRGFHTRQKEKVQQALPNNDSNRQSEHITKCKEGQDDESVEKTKGVTS
jgi:hypothetical protein